MCSALKTLAAFLLPVALGFPSTAAAQATQQAGAGTSAPNAINDRAADTAQTPAMSAPENAPAIAADSASGLRVDVYAWIWMIGLSGDVGARGRTAEVDASFGDILDASDSVLGFSGRLELGYGRIGGFIDGTYGDIGADDQTGPAGNADVDIGFEQGIVDFGVMFRAIDVKPDGSGEANARNLTLDLYAGGRFSSLDLGITPATLTEVSRSESWVDPIIGAKLGLPLAERWRLELNGDVGGFGVASDFTWSTTAVFGYDFSLFGLPATMFAGYRAIGWDYSDGLANDEFVFDIVQHGPILGISVRF
jgi:hypothetical protein